MRASADRTIWGNKGIIHETSFNDFEDGLNRFWFNTKREVLIERKLYNDEEKGELIYRKCINHRISLQSMNVPEYFIPGSYHALSEDKVVGWHPEYEKKLKELMEKGGKLDEHIE